MAANLYLSELLDIYGSLLTEKQFRVLDGYYNNDLSLSEIAENEGITRQGICDIIKRCEAQLTEYEQKLKLSYKLSSLKKLAAKAKDNGNFKNDLVNFIEDL